MKIAIINRAVSGSGKSTMSKEIGKVVDCMIHSTDDYHFVDGSYQFNPSRLGEYHKLNLEAFTCSCVSGIPVVICDNTNVVDSHCIDYVHSAKMNGYKVIVLHFYPDSLDKHMERNVHAVPLQAIERMIASLEQAGNIGEDVRFNVLPENFARSLSWIPKVIGKMVDL